MMINESNNLLLILINLTSINYKMDWKKILTEIDQNEFWKGSTHKDIPLFL